MSVSATAYAVAMLITSAYDLIVTVVLNGGTAGLPGRDSAKPAGSEALTSIGSLHLLLIWYNMLVVKPVSAARENMVSPSTVV